MCKRCNKTAVIQCCWWSAETKQNFVLFQAFTVHTSWNKTLKLFQPH